MRRHAAVCARAAAAWHASGDCCQLSTRHQRHHRRWAGRAAATGECASTAGAGCIASPRSSASSLKTPRDDLQTRCTVSRCVRRKGARRRAAPAPAPPPTDCRSGPSPQVAAADPLLCKGISSRQLQVVASGSGLPVIDLSQVSVSNRRSAGGERGAGGGWALRRSCFPKAGCWAGMRLRACKRQLRSTSRLCACVVLPAIHCNHSLSTATPHAPLPLNLQISGELAAAAEGADLVVLEGMGRSIETNLHARMRCGRRDMPGSRGGVVVGCDGLPPAGGRQERRLAAHHHTDPCGPNRHTTPSRCPALARNPHTPGPPPLPQLRPAERGHDQASRGGGSAGRPPLRLRVPVQALQHRRMTCAQLPNVL